MNGQNDGSAFTPGVVLKVLPNDQGRGELLGGVGEEVALDVIAMRVNRGGLDYLVIHENLLQPRWIGPNHVLRVATAA